MTFQSVFLVRPPGVAFRFVLRLEGSLSEDCCYLLKNNNNSIVAWTLYWKRDPDMNRKMSSNWVISRKIDAINAWFANYLCRWERTSPCVSLLVSKPRNLHSFRLITQQSFIASAVARIIHAWFILFRNASAIGKVRVDLQRKQQFLNVAHMRSLPMAPPIPAWSRHYILCGLNFNGHCR